MSPTEHIDAAIASLLEAKKQLVIVPPVAVTPPPVSALPQPAPSYVLPRESNSAISAVYGSPSRNPTTLEWFSFPVADAKLYERNGADLKSYAGDANDDHRTHRILAARLTNALAEIYHLLGEAEFKRQGWHVWGGSHNYRAKVGGSSLSTHAWAAAVDINPAENVFAQRTTTFSDAAINVMEKWGFLSGGRAWGKDWMHFQAVIPTISAGSYYDRNGLPKNIVAA